MDDEDLVEPEVDTPLTVSAERFHDPDERYMILLVGARRDFLFASAEAESVAVRFVRAVANIADPVYGEVGYLYGFPYTALESAMRLGFDRAGKNSRDRLPGYSWITVLPEQIGAALGGVDGLTDSGASGRWTGSTRVVTGCRRLSVSRTISSRPRRRSLLSFSHSSGKARSLPHSTMPISASGGQAHRRRNPSV